MNDFLLQLNPKPVWVYFREILSIPRPSKKEEQIIAYLKAFGEKHRLETIQDATGNILIRKPATKGFENRQVVVLQSHIDMVCEKNSDVDHNFDTDPIKARKDDGWIKATGTTLGADDGIGVAAQLALLAASDIAHGPIECLFTVDEETGLTGAFGLDENLLKGRILLNLDSEDEGELFIGCAGGKGTVASLAFKKENVPQGMNCYTLEISGLKGGHSGDDIHKGLGNANKILNRLLWALQLENSLRLTSFEGGNLHNAIAREAKAVFCLESHKAEAAVETIMQLAADIKSEYLLVEPELQIQIAPASETVAFVVDADSQKKLLSSLYACPHGVLTMSAAVANFVETSTNLASVRQRDDHWVIATSQRSSVGSALNDACQMVAACFLLAGAKVEHGDGYPGWAPNPNSAIRAITEEAYEKLFGKKAEVKAIHAGLECGLIGDKYPGIDMISYGPTIKGAHSPDERLKVDTVEKFWKLTIEILQNIPESKS